MMGLITENIAYRRALQRARTGAEVLDDSEPPHPVGRWYEEIDGDRLELEHPCLCVLGQLYGSFFEAPPEYRKYASDYGFDIESGVSNGPTRIEYRHLDAAWKKIIDERLALAS